MSTIPTILLVDEKEFETEKKNLKRKIMTFQNSGAEKFLN
jgi:hypothetical protein